MPRILSRSDVGAMTHHLCADVFARRISTENTGQAVAITKSRVCMGVSVNSALNDAPRKRNPIRYGRIIIARLTVKSDVKSFLLSVGVLKAIPIPEAKR